MNGAAYRLTPRTPGHWGPPEDEPCQCVYPDKCFCPPENKSTVPTPPTSTADWWLGSLAMTVGAHLDGRVGVSELRREYERFLRSPIVTGDDELRAILPPSKRRAR